MTESQNNILRILHLEDDPLDAELACAKLMEEGIVCEVLRVDTRSDFIEQLERNHIDLVLSDHSLPNFDGVTALAIVREKSPNLPFIFLTGAMGEDAAVETLKNGATDFVTKHSLSRLPMAVRRAVQEASEQKGRKEAQKALQYRLEFQRLMGLISSEFIHLPASEIDQGINRALKGIAEFAEVRHTYICQFSVDGKKFQMTHEWPPSFTESKSGVAKPLAVEAFPWAMEKFKNFEDLYIPLADALPPEASGERKQLEKDGVQSLICVPMIYAGSVLGFLGMDSLKADQKWAEDMTRLLHFAGQVFVQALKRKESAETERQLRQAQKMEAIGLLAGGVAHDFNNLLMAISGYCEMIVLNEKAGKPFDHEFNEVMKVIDKGSRLSRQLLAFSRNQLLEEKILDLSLLLSELERMLQRLIGEHIQFSVVPQEKLWPIKADVGQIEQIIMNLVINARDAMPDGGKLTVTTANTELDEDYARYHMDVRPGAYVMLSVSDSGTGMDEAVKSRIFEPFFTTKEEGKGTGLGLSTVYGIVQQNKGHIFVYSEPGMGTVFKVYFPRATEAVEKFKTSVTSLADSSGHETVFIVDDNSSVRTAIAGFLEIRGYTILQAGGGKEAIEIAKNYPGRIHALISDVVMPQMNGPELAQKLLEVRPDLKVLFLTGYSEETIKEDNKLVSSAVFLQKPVRMEVLVTKLRDQLAS
jgi:two-component system cell cycle sensor histidine kinase/response regulator CckA